MPPYALPPGSIGVDTSDQITDAQARELVSRHYTFALRSLSCPNSNIHPVTVSLQERDRILASGLALGFYQMFQTVKLTSEQGTKDALSALSQLAALSVPHGITIYGDSEGQAQATQQENIDYWNAWSSTLKSSGFTPGIYIGPGPHMTGAAYGALPNVHAYWQAGAAAMPYPSPRGHQMFQLNPPNIVIAGRAFDENVTQMDFKGGKPVLWKL